MLKIARADNWNDIFSTMTGLNTIMQSKMKEATFSGRTARPEIKSSIYNTDIAAALKAEA